VPFATTAIDLARARPCQVRPQTMLTVLTQRPPLLSNNWDESYWRRVIADRILGGDWSPCSQEYRCIPVESSFPTRFPQSRVTRLVALQEVGCGPYQSHQMFPGRKVHACPPVYRSIHRALGPLCLRAGGPESPKGEQGPAGPMGPAGPPGPAGTTIRSIAGDCSGPCVVACEDGERILALGCTAKANDGSKQREQGT